MNARLPSFGKPSPGAQLASVLTSRRDAGHWKEAIETMLSWRSRPEQFDIQDVPDGAVLDLAVEFATHQGAEGGPAPSSIVASGSGRIAMEWNDEDQTVIVEFVDGTTAVHTSFDGAEVKSRCTLVRNPVTRQFEIPGDDHNGGK